LRRTAEWHGGLRGACIALAIVLAIGVRCRGALAFSIGITGFSGKQGITCVSCHSGGAVPTVRFEGPDQLAAGAVATFRFVVQSQAAAQVAAGLNVATSAGKFGTIDGQGERLLGNEITHVSPKGNGADGSASWDFTWQAPAQAGPATLFGAGNSVNLNFTSFGDRSAATTFQVVVTGAAPPTETSTELPTPTATPSPPPTICVGDCDANGATTVNELVTGINIALGSDDLAVCPAFDVNQDGAVSVDELLQAVNAALNGCEMSGGQ
jgi:hypothetical protein